MKSKFVKSTYYFFTKKILFRKYISIISISIGLSIVLISAVIVSNSQQSIIDNSKAGTLIISNPCITIPSTSFTPSFINTTLLPVTEKLSTLNLLSSTFQNNVNKTVTTKNNLRLAPNYDSNTLNSANIRKYNLVKAMRTNPQLALDSINTSKLYVTTVNNCVEKQVTLEGNIEKIHIDDFKNKKMSMETYLVTKDNQRYVMHFPDMSQIMKIEGNVKLSGYLIDKDFLVDTNSATNPMNSMSLLSDKPNIPIQVGGNNTVGPENLMVAVVNFSDSSKILFDDQQISSLFLGSQDSAVNNFYKKYSYNKTIFTEKFVTNLDIGINHTCDYGTIKDATIKALDKKINVVDYNRLTVLFHNSACPYGGLGDVIGAKLPATTVSGGTAYFSTNIIPITNLGEPNSFPNFDQFYNFTSRAMNHELGHNLGLNHANFLYCNPSELNLDYCSYSNAESTLNTPHNIEYGSYFSQMGSFGGIDAAEKDRLTWFSDKLSTNNLISTITTSGDYNVLPLDIDLPCQNGTLSCGSKAYKITILNNPSQNFLNYLYISYIPLVDPLSPFIKQEGIILNTLTSDYHSELIDPHPLKNTVDSSQNDVRLKLGESFIDPQSNSKITVTRVSSSGINIHVDIGKTDFTPPKINITSPLNYATISGTVSINTTITTSSGIDHVEFYKATYCDFNKKTLLGQSNAIPYTYNLDTSLLDNGNGIGIYAIVYDKSGIPYNAPNNSSYSSCLSINVNNPPTELPIVVNFALPDGSAVLNPVTFNVDTIHSESISHVDYYLDDKNNNYILCSVTTTPYSCKEVNLTSGLHTITLKAYDHVGRIYQKSLNIQIIYPSTTVVITDPQNNGNIYPQNIFYGSPYYLVKADIKTNIQIDSVYLLMDGNFACDLYYINMDYECYLPISKLVLNSTHVLIAWATDVSGNPTSSNPITVKYGDNPSITTTIPTTNITTTMPLVTTTFIKRGPLVSGGPVQN